MGKKNYWRKASERALIEAGKSIGIDSRGRIMMAILSIAVALLCLAFWGSADASRDEAIVRLAIAGTLIFAFPFVFLWKLLGLPPRMHQELEVENAQLKSAALERKITADKVRTLSVLWEDGMSYTTEAIIEEQWPILRDNINKWGVLTLKYLAHHFSHQQAVSFKTVHFRTQNYTDKVNEEHGKKMLETLARCEQLKIIIDQHTSVWSPISALERQKIRDDLTAFERIIKAADLPTLGPEQQQNA